ncbi:hypothetical protein CHS0354_019250 [Potamilus streckersoni]|uniref:Uncharacterized protein n=1 Tax=Potamilus streckersoni TaxID=2493646 RepID=A0AAE0SZ92_9BIVA|nr:hypothetical protein CHS0354_019250 [Potamilus streckersoni]
MVSATLRRKCGGEGIVKAKTLYGSQKMIILVCIFRHVPFAQSKNPNQTRIPKLEGIKDGEAVEAVARDILIPLIRQNKSTSVARGLPITIFLVLLTTVSTRMIYSISF